ncbi:MAG: flavin reductase family protein, partial [Chloroflexota bacterium]
VVAGRKVASPILNMPGLHYECKIVYKSAMNPTYLDKEYKQAIYPKEDYHTLYFGEIVDCYELD